jgi:hypothetical protein
MKSQKAERRTEPGMDCSILGCDKKNDGLEGERQKNLTLAQAPAQTHYLDPFDD